MRFTANATLIAEFKRRRRSALVATGIVLALFALTAALHFIFPERPHPATAGAFIAAIAIWVAIGFKDIGRCPRCDAVYLGERENWFNPKACKECGQAFCEPPPNKSLERTRDR